MNMGILTTPAGGPAGFPMHGNTCMYRTTLYGLRWVGRIDTSIAETLVGGHREGQHPDLFLLVLRSWLVSFSRFIISRFNDSARAIAIMGMAQHSAATIQKAHLPSSHFFCAMGQISFIKNSTAPPSLLLSHDRCGSGSSTARSMVVHSTPSACAL